MQFGYSERCLAHDTGERHPENPDRLRAIRRGLAKRHGVEYVEADPATRSEVVAVHDEAYVDEFETFVDDGGGNWDPDTVASEGTWDAALTAAGLAQWAARAARARARPRRSQRTRHTVRARAAAGTPRGDRRRDGILLF
jgi:acetoin utilization deacetylase AcuC-like enzyme